MLDDPTLSSVLTGAQEASRPTTADVDRLDPDPGDAVQPTEIDIPGLNPLVFAEQAFADLDTALPVLLLPVRLETCFEPQGNPVELRIRVYPDVIHTDALTRDLSATEITIGQQYWRAVWGAPTDVPTREAAFRAVNRHLGARRGAWAVRRLTPTNLRARIDALASGRPTRQTRPTFPTVTTATRPVTPGARLLPSRWVAVGYREGAEVFRVAGLRIPTTLSTGLDHSPEASWAAGKGDPGMQWMTDYAEALATGMAITVSLTGAAADAANGLDELLVIGVAAGSDHDVTLVDLLTAHHYTRGATFVPSGTATNNTDRATAGYSAQIADLAAFVAAEIPPGPAALTREDTNAARLATALGITDASLLHRLDGGETAEQDAARKMNRVLWHCSIGALVDRLLSGDTTRMVSDAGVAWLETWFVENVRAGGPLPAFRVGAEPYGVLPVLGEDTRWVLPGDMTTDELGALNLRTVLAFLSSTWDAAVTTVPVLNPDTGDGGDAAVDEALVDILSVQPDAFRFSVRELENSKTLPENRGIVAAYNGRLLYMYIAVNFWDDKYVAPSLDSFQPARRINDLFDLSDGSNGIKPDYFTDIDNQITWFEDYADSITATIDAINRYPFPDATDTRNAIDTITSLRDAVLPTIQTLLKEHKARVDQLQGVWPTAPGGAVGADDPAMYYSLYKGDATRWVADHVQAPDATGGGTAASYLAWLAEHATTDGGATVQDSAPEDLPDPAPLLYQLAREAVIQAKEAPATVGTALNKLKIALEELALLPADELELRMQQTLGLASHRLDAWHTAFAKERLDTLRATTPTGLQVGGYAWVYDLKPDKLVDVTEGYIHAPSLQQAVTAAVLRSGWLAHRDDDQTPFAVDLQSARIRRAAWLFSGVRQGQSIAQLLGYQFERALHDQHLDRWIADFRVAVHGSGRQMVDGLKLLDDVDGAVQGVINGAGVADAKKLTTVLTDVASTLDAAADVSLAEAAHRLLQGDLDGTIATFSAISTGDAPPPALELPRTPRPGIHVTHRLMLLLPDKATPSGWAAAAMSLRAKAAPAVELWAQGLFGAAKQIGCTVRFSGTGAPATITVTLEQLGLGALDFAWTAPTQADGTPTELQDCVRAWLATQPAFSGFTASIDLETSTGTSLADALVLGRALRTLIASGRPTNAGDLALERATTDSRLDTALINTRATALLAGLDTARATLATALAAPTDASVRAALAPFAGWLAGVWAAMALSGTALVTAATTVSTAAARRAEAARAESDGGKQLVLLAGFPVPLPFRPADPTGLAATYGRSVTRQGTRLAATGWLNQVDRVRDGAGRMNAVRQWTEVLADKKTTDLAVLQLPDVAGETWAALSRPGASRVSMVMWPGTGLKFTATGRMVGLVFDEWVETIPSDRQVTGLTLGFDAPASRPPQVALLVVTAAGVTWSFEHMRDTLRDTWAWTKRRAVDPERLQGLGHYLPTIFSEATLDPGDGEVSLV